MVRSILIGAVIPVLLVMSTPVVATVLMSLVLLAPVLMLLSACMLSRILYRRARSESSETRRSVSF